MLALATLIGVPLGLLGGGHSARAARALVEMGFVRVMNLAGGVLAYNEAGLPVERV